MARKKKRGGLSWFWTTGHGQAASVAGIGSFVIALLQFFPRPSNPDGILGCWIMYGNRVRAEADHTVSGGLLEVTWRHAGGRSYQVEWPRVTDVLQLAPDRNSFAGANIFGAPIVGQRASGAAGASGFAGAWKYNNVDLWADADGNVGLGTLTGTWTSPADNVVQINWTHNVIGDYTLSEDGQRLDGQDNFGQPISALRTPC